MMSTNGFVYFLASGNFPVPQSLCYMTAHVFEASEMKFGDISSTVQAISIPLLPKKQTPVCDMMFPFARVKGWPAVRNADLVAGHSGMSPEE